MNEPTTIGLSEQAHRKLKRLHEDGHFQTLMDGYRFAIALAIAYGAEAAQEMGTRQTIFNVGSLDHDKKLFNAVKALFPAEEGSIYKIIERLAEWGVEELDRLSESGDIQFSSILDECDEKLRA